MSRRRRPGTPARRQAPLAMSRNGSSKPAFGRAERGIHQFFSSLLERSPPGREHFESFARQLALDAKRRKLAEIERSQEIREIIEFISRTLIGLVKRFRNEGMTIVFTDSPFPSNVFSSELFQLKLYVDASDYWSLHFVDREFDKIGLTLVRIVRQEHGREILTNDSIVFRWVDSDQYGFSLNGRISPEVRENVFGNLNNNLHPISQAKKIWISSCSTLSHTNLPGSHPKTHNCRRDQRAASQ